MVRGLRPLVGFVSRVLGGLLRAVGAPIRKAIGPAPVRSALTRSGGKAAREFGHRAGNRVPRAACTVTGHPVDVATGKVFTSFTDLELAGPLPFALERVWFSTSGYAGPFGHGWHNNFDAGLYVTAEAVVYRTPDGRFVDLAPVEAGEAYFDRRERLTIGRDAAAYKITGADGITRSFTPGLVQEPAPEPVRWVLREVASRAGHRITLAHDERDRLVEIVDSGGRSLRFEHDDAGRIVGLTAPHPDRVGERYRVCAYGYDEAGNLISMTDARGFTFSYAYAGHLLVRETDRNGLSFHFAYEGDDVTARCVRTWGDGGLYRRELAYAPGLTTVTDSLGFTSTHRHEGGLVTETVDALGGLTKIEYAYGQPVEQVDPLGRTTAYAYDARGNLRTVTSPDGTRVETRFDERDLPVESIDRVGGRWQWTYDDRGLLTLQRDPLERVTRLSHERGMVSSVTDPAGGETKIDYDDHGLPVQVTTPDGERTRWERNALGWPVAEVNPLGARTRRTFDAWGNVVRVEEPDGNVRRLAHDGEGNVTRVTDRLHDVGFGYGGMDRLAWRSQSGTTVRFEYDTEEQLTAVVNEHGSAYSFSYGPTGLVTSERGFGGIVRRYERDIGGRVMSVRRGSGLVTRCGYDQMDRLTEVLHADGTSQRYAYRADGALIAAANSTIEVRFERDLVGRVLRETQGEHWVASEYDLLDNRIRMTSSLGADQRITRTAMGDVAAISGNGAESSYLRDALGQELSRELPGGVSSRWERDAAGRPVRQEIAGGGVEVRERRYEWGVGVRLNATLDSLNGPIRYAHDGLGQLVSAAGSDGTVELRMPDAIGNLFRTEDRSDRVYGPAGEVLEAVNERGHRVRYEYDADGNRVAKTTEDGERWEYRWDAEGYLAAVVRPDGAEVMFAYDAFGRRISKTSAGTTTRWIWDGDNPLHEWTEEAVAVEAEAVVVRDADAAHRDAVLTPCVRRGPPEKPITWLFEPDTFTPAARIGADRTEYAVTDHLGMVIAVFDADGGSVWSGDVDLWGNSHSVSGVEGAWPFRWPGQYHDPETGLHYNRHRYYDPDTGTYLSVDPIGLQGGLRIYAYVADVLAYADPLGLAGARYPEFRGAGQRPRYLPAPTIRFSQSSVNGAAEIEASMRASGWVGSPIDVVRMPDQRLTSVDNTRLLAARRAEIDVLANVHAFSDRLPEEFIDRFTTPKGGVPATWGDSVINRIHNQGARYRKSNPFGSWLTGWRGN